MQLVTQCCYTTLFSADAIKIAEELEDQSRTIAGMGDSRHLWVWQFPISLWPLWWWVAQQAASTAAVAATLVTNVHLLIRKADTRPNKYKNWPSSHSEGEGFRSDIKGVFKISMKWWSTKSQVVELVTFTTLICKIPMRILLVASCQII